jgi:osomolarity two-component system, sensor histidine kinase SLN1
VVGPITHLRDIILACIFAVAGVFLLVVWPLAHYAVTPIRLLQRATKNSVSVYQDDEPTLYGEEDEIQDHGEPESLEKKDRSYLAVLFPWKSKSRPQHKECASSRQNTFHIPQKVPARRVIVSDELTDLVGTFNEMSDELTLQYSKLEERVKVRTAELEQSRNAAQVANESKTLFVANISHELRTPLNGILGMCSIALHERDTSRVRQALKIIYKSGDLLLHLLNDLLTFSRNSYGEHLAIEEETFHLVDIGTQITSIFEKQAREAQIDLKVVYVGVANTTAASDNVPEKEMVDTRAHLEANAYGPGDTGLVRDMSLRGDKHRILQILMNLVSNSLKFTPENGAVEVRIKCMGYAGLKLPLLSRRTTTTPRGRDSLVRTRPREASYTLNREVSENLTNLAFQFEVEDTGPGVSEHMQEEIFKPFVQGDLALSKKYGGTGLGLAICSQLAALMHGKISLKSTISVGSTFTLSLNLRYLKEQAASFSTATDRPGSLPSMSKPNSMVVSSFRERASSRSPIRSVRRHSPSRLSISSTHDGLLPRDNMPRIVGYSQPYISDDRHQGDHSTPQRPLTPPLAHNMIHHKLDAAGSRPTSSHSRLNTSLAVPTVVSTPPHPPQVNESRRVKDKATGVTASSNGINQHRVLIAEDNKINQEVVVRMLKLEKVTGKNVTS